ncbi:MAG TPA: class I SAM-dependent methyltransferase [Cyclobacteriaceae bacterium]|nr:class I SAM-dependent methyltransferase [Cyclobacteriaceae bacterium]
MELFNPAIFNYCEAHTTEEDPILQHIERETFAKVLMPRMLSGKLQGKMLEMFSKMLSPASILEIGTYTGYSAICLAKGLAPSGKLITVDINGELEERVKTFFDKSGLSAKIDYRIGNALDIIPQLKGNFDMVFIDADKTNYNNYYSLLVDRINPGGLLLADNVLWSGKILLKNEKIDKDTKALVEFNRLVQADPRVENVLLPIRDGILMARKL